MLWLIQRDFLQGKTVQDMVTEALLPVANPYEDQDIAQVNILHCQGRKQNDNSLCVSVSSDN